MTVRHATHMPDHIDDTRFLDRRSPRPTNRARRFFNSYWLIPMMIIGLQLVAATMHAGGRTEATLTEQNQAFFAGMATASDIVTTDFPFGVIGHAKELIHVYHRSGPAPTLVARAAGQRRAALLQALAAAAADPYSERGGILRVADDGALTLHPIRSENARFLASLEGLDWAAGIGHMTALDAREITRIITDFGTIPLAQVADTLANPTVPAHLKPSLYDGLRYAMQTTSQSRYVLSPMALKTFLGHLPGATYAGVFHFHTQMNAPPSAADIAASFQMRQFVFVPTPHGFDLYDIRDGVATRTAVKAIPGHATV